MSSTTCARWSTYYRLREGGAPEDLQLAEGLGIVLGIVGYKVVDGETTLGNASVTLEGEEIVIRDAGRGSGRAATTRIPLWSLLAADGTGGRLTLHRSGAAPLVIRGRGGLLASKPRPDHYLVLERWLAPAAAAAAERRWTAVGAAAHAAEIGVVATDEPDGPEPGPALAGVAPVAPQPGSASVAPPAGSVADALRALEQLRDDGLVSDDEYALKRREILARL